MAFAVYVTVAKLIPTDVLQANVEEYMKLADSDIQQAINLSTKFAALGNAVHVDLANMLACHYTAAFADPRATEEKKGERETKWWNSVGKGYDLTPFGQMALRRDSTGTLKSIADGGTNAVTPSTLGVGSA